MISEVYQYAFVETVSMDDVESTLQLALLSTTSLHGQTTTRLNARFAIDKDQRTCVIEAATPVGIDLNKLFVGYVTAELGQHVFQVRRVAAASMAAPVAA